MKFTRRPYEVEAFVFDREGSHPLVRSQWARRGKWHHGDSVHGIEAGWMYHFYEEMDWPGAIPDGKTADYARPVTKDTPGAEQMHFLEFMNEQGHQLTSGVEIGDWIVKHSDHDYRVMKPEAFSAKFTTAKYEVAGHHELIEYLQPPKLEWEDEPTTGGVSA